MPETLTVEVSQHERTTALAYQAPSEIRMGATLLLAHGAGAGQRSTFIVGFARGLASRGVDVLTFNFMYTELKRRTPDRTEKLESCYRAALSAAAEYAPFSGNKILIGGKSMGGRIASHLAARADTATAICGLVLLGYPLHPPGKPDQLRSAHLEHIRVPILCIQGGRDPFGTPAELHRVFDPLATRVTLHIVENGDHSLAPPPIRLRSRRLHASYGAVSRRSNIVAEADKSAVVSTEEIYDGLKDLIARWTASLIQSC